MDNRITWRENVILLLFLLSGGAIALGSLIVMLLMLPDRTVSASTANPHPHQYTATIESVYDGDTITADINLGFGVILDDQKLRLLGVDTPELRGEERIEGLRVRDLVRGKLPKGSHVVVESEGKKGKYGRWLVDVIAEGESVNQWLIGKGFKYEIRGNGSIR